MISREHYNFIKQHPAFENFPVEIFDKMAIEIKFRKIPKGQIIFFAGDRRDKLLLLYKGYVRIEQYDKTDTFSYMDYVKEEALFPYGGMFYEENYHYTASSITDLEYFLIPVDLFETYSKKNEKQLLFLNKELSKILAFQELRIMNGFTASAAERVIQSLSILCVDFCQDQSALPFLISMKELAKLGATTRETVNQVLKRLLEEGRISYEHKQVIFLDKMYFLRYFKEGSETGF